MPTVKTSIANTTGAGSAATRYTKSAKNSATVIAQSGMLGSSVKRRKSLVGKGG